MFLSEKKRRESIITNLVHSNSDLILTNHIFDIQNGISISFNGKVTGIVSCDDDVLAAAFSVAYANTFVKNGLKTLIIDANLYNQCLERMLNDYHSDSLDHNFKFYSIEKTIYPSDSFVDNSIFLYINESLSSFDRIIVLLPSLNSHKDIITLSSALNSVILIALRNKTKKRDLSDAINFMFDNNLPLSKTVILK